MWRRLLLLGLMLGLVFVRLSARGGGGCVAAGTLIDTPAGPRAVESLHAGDAVWSLQAGHRVRASVEAIYEVAPAEFIELTAGRRTLQLTPEHPVQIAPGAFVRADRLVEQTGLFTPAERVPLTRLRRLRADVPAYNLVVSPGGVFYANGLLVHNKGCFLPDTPIALADGGQRAIRQLRAGDRVLALSPAGLPAVATVRRVLTHEVESYLIVRTGTTELHVTEEHPFYVGDGEFRTIESLRVGDSIHAYDGSAHFGPQRILAMERRSEHVTVYNLEVDAPHTYVASGIAVHNKGGGGCFAPGTRIATPAGPRAIETLALGDTVLAPRTDGRLAPAAVTGVYLNFSPLLVLRTTLGELRTTEEHPLLTTAGTFLPARELGVGASLMRADGQPAAIEAISRGTDAGPVYTLQVAGPHTFVAGGFVVHNKGGGGSGYHRSSGGGDGNADPVVSLVIIGLMIAFIAYKIRHPGESSADEDLDYCFSRSEIEPKAANTRKLLEFIARTDASVTPDVLMQTATGTFTKLQECWSAREYAPMQPLLMADLYAQHCDQLRGLRQNHELNKLEDLRIEQIDLIHLDYTDRKDTRSFTALFTAWLRDYYVDDRTGEVLRGDDQAARFQEFWTFQYGDGAWRLREIEQSRETDYLRSENFFESFTETGRDQVYGETAGRAGPLGPDLPPLIQEKDAHIDRLLNFLYVTDKIWDREAMLATARRGFAGVLLAWQDGRPEAFSGLGATPGLLAHFRSVNEANQRNHWRIEYRNLCVRKIEIVHVNNRHDRASDDFTVRLSAHAQVIATQNGAVQYKDEFVKPWVEFWTFGRSGKQWVLKEILPGEKGAALVALENTDEGSSVEMLQWYYSKERAT